MVNFSRRLLFSPVLLKGKQIKIYQKSFPCVRNLTEEAKTHYGFETVSESEKARRVHAVFENVASSYDLMNDFMSGGVHRLWKDAFMSKLAPVPGTRLLDVAGGTGDIAFRFLKYLQVPARKELVTQVKPHPVEEELRMHTKAGEIEREATQEKSESFVMVCDINEAMLQVGQSRAKEMGYVDKRHTDWLVGDAQSLPLKDESFDAYTIAFGIRNVVDVQMALEEAYRVLRPGGRFMCLEFSHVPNPLLRSLYDMYSFNVIPPMGQLVAQDYKSYKYLVESIRRFPDQETFKSMIEQAGFRQVKYENFTFGVVAVHSGFKL